MAIQTIKLSDCMDIQPGMSIKQRLEHDPEGEAQVLTPGHLSGKLIYSFKEQHTLKMNLERGIDKYQIIKGDVLFISRGQSNYASYTDSVNGLTVANNTIYRLRPIKPDSVDPLYVAWSLNQAPMQAAISMIRTGSGAPIVQRKNFCDLAIPLPPLAKQRKLGELGQLFEQQQLLQQQLLNNTEQYHRAIGQRCLTALLNTNTTTHNSTLQETT